MNDWRLEEQKQEYEEAKRREVLWETANQIATGSSKNSAITKAELIVAEREEAMQNEEKEIIWHDEGRFSFIDSRLEGTTAPSKKQAVAIYHKLCEEKGINPKPYPFQF